MAPDSPQTMATEVHDVATPHGTARLHIDRGTSAAPGSSTTAPVATLVLGHGAGRGGDSPDLEALAEALPAQGITVVRIEQPWHVAGRKVAGRPAVLDEATRACLDGLAPLLQQRGLDAAGPLVVGGRSAGARVACRLASSVGAVGCLALAFPLHPPGKPDKTRLPELLGAGVPTFVVQGERDAFGGPAAFPEHVDLTVVPEADHGFRVGNRAVLSQADTYDLVVEAVVEWVTARVA